MPLASTTGPLTITKPEAGDNVKTHETGTGATGYNHANLDNINAALNATTGHDHDGTDSKKVLATNLDRTGGTARQQLVVNSGATALEYAASMQSLLTAQGDLPYASAANTPARLAKGTAAQGLVMNPGATAPEWVDVLPWLIDVDVLMTAVASTNWNTNVVEATSSLYSGFKQTTAGAQNDMIAWDLVLGAGTWTVEIMHVKADNRGIYSVQLDDVEKGTIDGYNASTTYNNLGTVTGIAVAASGKSRLKLVMATKNASSSAYYGSVQHIQLRRTA